MGARGEGGFQSIPYGRFFASDSESACMLSLDFAKRINDKAPGTLVGQQLILTYPSAPGMMRQAGVACPIRGVAETGAGAGCGRRGASGLTVRVRSARADSPD